MADKEIQLTISAAFATISLGRAHCLDRTGKQSILQMFQTIHDEADCVRGVILRATHPAAWLVDVPSLWITVGDDEFTAHPNHRAETDTGSV